MKTISLLAISSLFLGLSHTAFADHHETQHDHAAGHGHSWQNADKNKDGAVSKEEFMTQHQQQAEKMFLKLDTNKDGKVEESELKAMHEKCERHAK